MHAARGDGARVFGIAAGAAGAYGATVGAWVGLAVDLVRWRHRPLYLAARGGLDAVPPMFHGSLAVGFRL